jgi:penicillin-binding protein 1A
MKKIIVGFSSDAVSLMTILTLGVSLLLATFEKTLPDYRDLKDWTPPLLSRFYDSRGELIAETGIERRLYTPIGAVPDLVKAAFLSAEDKNFYEHGGIEWTGLLRAAWSNALNYGSGQRMAGASTITQQVVKNLILSPERTVSRKLQEAVLAIRLEHVYSKDHILELYMNSIYLGLGSYGVASASLTYFGKPLNELSIAEAAYLASLPKAPNNYNPFLYPERAVSRRNWVILRMAQNGYINAADAVAASHAPLGTTATITRRFGNDTEYFASEVRRQITAAFGSDAIYTAGVSVRTTLDMPLQTAAVKALRSALVKYDQEQGYRGALGRVGEPDSAAAFDGFAELADVPEWRLAIVRSVSADKATLRLKARPDMTDVNATLSLSGSRWALRMVVAEKKLVARALDTVLSVGDVVFVEKQGEGYLLRQRPAIQGALAAMDPHTGRVVALVGGFSYAQSEFNRATQAYRQPGSAFKPFVYAAALDSGYTPSTLVLDAPFSMPDGTGREWRPKNYDGKFSGPSTLRVGLELSRNLMTVRLAKQVGIDLVAQYAENFGLYDHLDRYLPMALGAGETTLLRLVSAYSVIANGGKSVKPSMIDRIQDRTGKTIYRQDETECLQCNGPWKGQAEPALVDKREQILDPMTAYQVTSMLQGVVERGTGRAVRGLGVPVAGKTGTTNDEKDVWFVGFTPSLVAGIFIGYDNPRHLGAGESGGGLAAPVFLDFMKTAVKGKGAGSFPMPDGMTFYSIDRNSGRVVDASTPGAIREAFKPGTAPCSECAVIDGSADTGDPTADNTGPAARRRALLETHQGLF